jgi:hypothetical protein
MFTITRGTGFQIEFSNKWTVSVQFSSFHYCEKRDWSAPFRNTIKEEFYTSATAEVAVIDPDGKFVPIEGQGDSVSGWVKADEVAQIIAAVARYRKE